MPAPAQLRNAAAQLLDAAFDNRQAGQPVNENVRVTIAGRVVKLQMVGNDLDHPKGFVLRVTWKPADGA